MEMLKTIIFIFSIFLAIIYSFSNLARLIYKQGVSFLHIIMMGLGLTGVITHFLGIY